MLVWCRYRKQLCPLIPVGALCRLCRRDWLPGDGGDRDWLPLSISVLKLMLMVSVCVYAFDHFI